MPQTLAVVTLNMKTGILADAVQNSFAFSHSTVLDGAGATAIADQLSSFYTQDDTSMSNPVSHYLAQSVDEGVNAHQVDLYDITGHLNGSPHGAPTFTRTFGTSDVGANSLPSELCVCVSFHSAYGTDVEFGAGASRPRARDRGRIYFGPLAESILSDSGVTHKITITGIVLDDLAFAAGRLQGDPDFTWSVWSRADATLKGVTSGWIDNAFDVQRRRGIAATARVSF